MLVATAGRRGAARWTVARTLGLRQSDAFALQRREIGFVLGTLVEQLREHREMHDLERLVAGTEWDDWELVFTQPHGRQALGLRSLDAAARGRRRAHIRLHDGRHTAATLLLTAGTHPRVVMELLGHSQMCTTMDISSHVMPALAREAADRVATALWG